MTPGEEHVLFLQQLGKAFAQWSNVENALRHCVIACFTKPDHNSLSLGFFSIQNFRSKLEFAEKVLDKKLAGEPPFVHDWAALVKRTETASKMRNKLAHGATTQYPQGKPGRRLLLCPWIFPKPKKTKIPKPPAGSLGLLDIVRCRLEFEALALSLKNFAHRLLRMPEQYPKSSEQAMNPPTLQKLVRLIHEELGHPPKSSRQKS